MPLAYKKSGALCGNLSGGIERRAAWRHVTKIMNNQHQHISGQVTGVAAKHVWRKRMVNANISVVGVNSIIWHQYQQM